MNFLTVAHDCLEGIHCILLYVLAQIVQVINVWTYLGCIKVAVRCVSSGLLTAHAVAITQALTVFGNRCS